MFFPRMRDVPAESRFRLGSTLCNEYPITLVCLKGDYPVQLSARRLIHDLDRSRQTSGPSTIVAFCSSSIRPDVPCPLR